MRINIYPVAANRGIVLDLNSLIKTGQKIHVARYSTNIGNTFRYFGKSTTVLNTLNVLFIDDFSLDKLQIIDQLKSSAFSSVKNKSKKLIYTDSLNGRYINDLILANVNGILHKNETFLSKNYFSNYEPISENRCSSKKLIEAGREKIIGTIKLIEKGSICYDGIIHSILLKKHIWSKSINDFNIYENIEQGETGQPVENARPDIENPGLLVAKLSKREKEIIILIAEGKQNKKIAETLDLSVSTVETHKANILLKLNLKTSIELLTFAVQNQKLVGLI